MKHLSEISSENALNIFEAIATDNSEIAEFFSIISPHSIQSAHLSARKGKSKYKEVQQIDANPNILGEIYYTLKDGYQVSPYATKKIYETQRRKERTLLKLPYYPDRIIQWVLMQYLEPILTEKFSERTCASIKGRGIELAFKLTENAVTAKKGNNWKYSHCLKIDVRKFYQSINHSILKKLIEQLQLNSRIETLLFDIIDSVNSVPQEISGNAGGCGLPIGSYVSQFLANLYLTPIDKWLEKIPGIEFVRYMDDIVIFGDSHFLHELRKVLNAKLQTLKLTIKSNWQIYNITKEGIDFVGYRFYRHYIKIRNTTKKHMIKHLNARNSASYYGIAKRSKNQNFLNKYFPQYCKSDTAV